MQRQASVNSFEAPQQYEFGMSPRVIRQISSSRRPSQAANEEDPINRRLVLKLN
jgi:hypothetical protein